MPRDFPRARRIQEQVQRELSGLLRQAVKDPRVSDVTLTDVEVSRDLSLAKVFVTSMNTEVDHKDVIAALNGAAGFLRRELGALMRIRSTPKLQFYYDESIEYGAKMDALINSAIDSDNKQHSKNEEE